MQNTSNEFYLLNIIERFVNSEKDKLKSKVEEVKKKGSWDFIPYRSQYIFNNLLEIKKLEPRRSLSFIDYGCGIGNASLIADVLGFDAYGLERELPYIEIAKGLLYNKNRIISGDLEIHDFKPNYDVVYFYCPFQDRDKEYKFEKKVVASVPIGGYLMPTSCGIFANDYIDNLYKGLIPLKKKFEEVIEGAIWKRIK